MSKNRKIKAFIRKPAPSRKYNKLLLRASIFNSILVET